MMDKSPSGLLWYVKWILTLLIANVAFTLTSIAQLFLYRGYEVDVTIFVFSLGWALGSTLSGLVSSLEGLLLYKGIVIYKHIINGGKTSWKEDILLIVSSLYIVFILFVMGIGEVGIGLTLIIKTIILTIVWYRLEKIRTIN